MYRGIDPEGLLELAATTRAATASVVAESRPVAALLERRDQSDAAALLAGICNRLADWGRETADTLVWRSTTISAGQETVFNIAVLLRAEFAAAGLFTLATVEAEYQLWLAARQASFDRAEDAAQDIASWLDQSWRDWDVSNSDLQHIWRTLAALSGPELDHVLAALSPVQLERWITEMGHSVNGFSREEKQELFAMLAANASGESLARIHQAVLATSGVEESFDLGIAIRTHSPDQVIADFVSAVVSARLAEHAFSHLAPGLAVAGIASSEAATDVTRALARNDGAAAILFTDVALVEQSAPGTVAAIASVLAETNDGEDRAHLFATLTGMATGQLGSIVLESRGASLEQIAQTRAETLAAATRLLAADPGSVIKQLATTLDPDGSLLTTYWHLMAEQERAGEIATILERLRRGGWVDLDRFSDSGSDPDYSHPHARNLAFAAGTLVSAFTMQADEAKGRVDDISRLAGLLTTVVGFGSGASGLAESALDTGADLVISEHGNRIADGIDESLAALIDQVARRLLPLEKPIDGPPGYGGAMRVWSDVYLRLVAYA